MADERVSEEKKDRPIKLAKKDRAQSHADGSGSEGRLSRLQKTVGNRAVQRLLVQLKCEGSYELDEETTERINRERDGGQSLDEGVSEKMGTALDADFSDVRVHTSPEAADLSSQLSAKAFTTGKDIFFGEKAYAPGSSSGQELLAHELTHVVQQSNGAVGGGNHMTVNAPGDAFEQQADAVSGQQPDDPEPVQAHQQPDAFRLGDGVGADDLLHRPMVHRAQRDEHQLAVRDDAALLLRREPRDQPLFALRGRQVERLENCQYVLLDGELAEHRRLLRQIADPRARALIHR